MMDRLERLGHDRESGRELALLRVAHSSSLTAFRAPSPHFACLLVWDSGAEPIEALTRVAELLLDSGCVYVCAWGAGCERLHDVLDEVAVERSRDPGCEPVVMTSWHADEPLEEALFFFLHTSPDEAFRDTCRSGIALVMGGDDEQLATVRRALSRPEVFVPSASSTDDAGAAHANAWRSLRIGIGCLVAGLLGRAAILLIAAFLPGGHPPLSAYVEVPLTLVMLPVSLAGALVCALAARRDSSAGARGRLALVAAGNLALLVLGALSLTRGLG